MVYNLFFYIDTRVLLENSPPVKFMHTKPHLGLTSEYAYDFAGWYQAWLLNFIWIRWCIMKTYLGLPRKSSQSSATFVWPSDKFWRIFGKWSTHSPFSSPEAALLLVSTKNHDLWEQPFWNTKELTQFCPSGFIAQSTSYLLRMSAGQGERRLWERDCARSILKHIWFWAVGIEKQ